MLEEQLKAKHVRLDFYFSVLLTFFIFLFFIFLRGVPYPGGYQNVLSYCF